MNEAPLLGCPRGVVPGCKSPSVSLSRFRRQYRARQGDVLTFEKVPKWKIKPGLHICVYGAPRGDSSLATFLLQYSVRRAHARMGRRATRQLEGFFTEYLLQIDSTLIKSDIQLRLPREQVLQIRLDTMARDQCATQSAKRMMAGKSAWETTCPANRFRRNGTPPPPARIRQIRVHRQNRNSVVTLFAQPREISMVWRSSTFTAPVLCCATTFCFTVPFAINYRASVSVLFELKLLFHRSCNELGRF